MMTPLGGFVSSAHLADGELPALSELEFGLILLSHAFERWMVRCARAAGVNDLSPLDVLVLHSVNHRDRQKRLADVCLVLNIEDTHTVDYSVRKLQKLKLVETGKKGKEKMIGVTDQGKALCKTYREYREAMLVQPLLSLDLKPEQLSHIAEQLRFLSGQYDQAARTAASI
ncbi:MAG: winged helix DNA-binding protein [Gammaproteobacteria bacterium]|nr:winged helix DNA-binding protein [Gammaproteobacteria bacterium]